MLPLIHIYNRVHVYKYIYIYKERYTSVSNCMLQHKYPIYIPQCISIDIYSVDINSVVDENSGVDQISGVAKNTLVNKNSVVFRSSEKPVDENLVVVHFSGVD